MTAATASPTGKELGFEPSIDLLRALAEPTRFRLLALFTQAELTVGEIAEVLEQSQPRISRHLKLLSDVAALERFPEEQRVYYRLTNGIATGNRVAELVGLALRLVGGGDEVLGEDRRRLKQVLDKRVRNASAKWEDVRRSAESTYSDAGLVEAVLKEVGDDSLGELLDVGTGSGSMLRVLGSRARHAVGLDSSTQALRVARAKVHGAGLNHCEFKQGDMYALPFETGSFDAVAFDHVLSAAERPGAALTEAARVLRRGGRVIVVENDDKPLAMLQGWFEGTGMQCRKIKKVGAAPSQLLFAVAQAT